jgi:hypothetical protein
MSTISESEARIRLGLVGARKLGTAGDWLKQTLTQVWSASQGLLEAEVRSSGKHVVRLAAGLADGADQIAVASFCQWRDQQGDELLLIYPCLINDFASNSGLIDVDGFHRMRAGLPQDVRTRELELDGRMPRTADADRTLAAQEKRLRSAAHQYQAEVLIRQSEFLVAVLDRHEPGEAGGTRETVLRALALDTPVLVIDPCVRVVYVLTHPADLRPDFNPEHDDWRRDWWTTINRVVLPTLRVAGEHASLGIEAIYDVPRQLTVSSRWDKFQAPFALFAAEYARALLSHLTLPGSNHGEQPAPSLAQPSFWTVRRTLWKAVLGMLSAPRMTQSQREHTSTIEDWRGEVANQQSAMMAEYRSLFLSNYWLGLGAVVLALIILVTLALSHLKLGLGLLIAVLLLTVTKFCFVWQISRNTKRAEHLDASGVAVGLRYIAERLRAMPLLISLGSSRIDLVHPTPRRGRPHQIAEDLCRRLPLEDCVHTHDSSASLNQLSQFIRTQIEHHVQTHATMEAMRRMLERGVALSGKMVIWIVGLDLLVLGAKLILKSPIHPCVMPGSWVDPLGSLLSYTGVVLVVLTALLPALMATLNAILFQGQAEQLADRHGAMAEALSMLGQEAENLRQRLVNGALETGGSHAVLSLTERTVRLMAEEVSEWATMYNQGVKEA